MIEQQYIDLFETYREEIDKNATPGLNKERDAAFESFKKLGFPTSEPEDYKHSDISRAFDTELGLNLRNIPIPVNPYDAFKCDVPNLNTHVFFLINDRYYDKPRSNPSLPEGVFAGSLQTFSEKYPRVFNAYYNKIADYSNNGVAAYNTMFAQDGFVVYVPENTVVEKPLQLINILRGGVDLNVNRRILLIVGKNARVKLLVCDHTVDDVHFVVTQVIEIAAEENAQIDLYELEENSEKATRISLLYCNQQERSKVTAAGITLHNGYTRNDYRFKLLGEYAETHVGGLAISDKNSIPTILPFSIMPCRTAPATNCLSMSCKKSRQAFSAEGFWWKKERKNPELIKVITIFVFRTMRICMPSLNWRFMPMM